MVDPASAGDWAQAAVMAAALAGLAAAAHRALRQEQARQPAPLPVPATPEAERTRVGVRP
ncbi:MAG TPA: hypothetical protein VFD04_10320 [Actinomycetes bacterium]|nr:hypothetical protein [Actinomycetes bacterium]